MMLVDPKLSTTELLRLAADCHQKKVEISYDELQELTALLKARAADELDYGQELEVDNVRLVRRVNGAVGIYYS